VHEYEDKYERPGPDSTRMLQPHGGCRYAFGRGRFPHGAKQECGNLESNAEKPPRKRAGLATGPAIALGRWG